MIEPRPLGIGDGWADHFGGAPVIESVLQAFVGQCQECGRPAEAQHEGSVLIQPVVVDGTLYGDTFCLGCIDEDEVEGPAFVLPQLPEGAEGEGD